MRALVALCLVGACARGSAAYHLSVPDAYEVGENATIGLRVGELTDEPAVLVITRPDGSTVRTYAPLDTEVSRIRLGAPLSQPGVEPTFTMVGNYLIELRAGARVLAKHELEVTSARLDEILPDEEIAGYKPVTRYTRRKQSGQLRWKTYGAIYEHPVQSDATIEVVIELPGPHLVEAWKPYEEDTTLAVIANNNVRLRERAANVSASWRASEHIVTMRAPMLADLERGLIAHFLARFPSKLLPQ